MTEEEYNKALQDLDNSDIEDIRKAYDLYVCNRCGEFIVTTTAVKGHIPVLFQCDKCNFGLMKYRRTAQRVDDSVILTHWRRPTYEEFCEMSPKLQQQILEGLLIMG